MWEIGIGNQAVTLLCSAALGFLLCFIYDIIRALRSVRGDFVFVLAGDLLFWFISSLCVFMFLLSRTNGEVRGYVLLSAAGGFMLSRLTFSRLSFTVFKKIFTLSAHGAVRFSAAYRGALGKISEFLCFIGSFCVRTLNKKRKIKKNS